MEWERQGVGPFPQGKLQASSDKGIPKITVDKFDKAEPDSRVPLTRSDSDLGETAVSMPDITIALADTGSKGMLEANDNDSCMALSGSKLNVYCSPRMSRRQFEEDDSAVGKDCWIDGFETSRSLLSLRSSPQIGSTTSLDTNFTGRSLGLLSDDSDRTFLSDKPYVPSSPTRKLLRRFFSNPENCPGGGANISRSTKSWTSLKDAQMTCVDIEEVEKRLTEESGSNEQIEIETLLENLNKSDPTSSFDILCDETVRSNLMTTRRTHKGLSEGRIRKWLDDLNPE